MGPGFGGINIGGFALPELNMEEINAGIASQLGPEIAAFLAEQELANATNEYEKDAAETKVEQIKEFEAGLGSLPPSVEQIIKEIQAGEGIASGYEGDGYERSIDEAPRDPIQEIIEQIIETSPEPSRPVPEVIMERDDPVMPIDPYYNPNYFSFEDERMIGRENEIDQEYLNKVLADLAQTEEINQQPVITASPTTASVPAASPTTASVPAASPTSARSLGGFTDIVQLPEVDPTFTVAPQPAPSPVYGFEDPAAQTGSEAIYDPGYRRTNPAITNLIMQQREAYNSALRNPVYRAPDTVQPDYVRPMSAAEFGSVPGRYTPPVTGSNLVNNREQNINTDIFGGGFLAMNRGGSLNNRMGLGGLPPMQQNDKLTQLFAQSFRPRR
tara:strand:- start:707 stop:1864 length:1158 start_codon:yes stop_codon:yes gene_type:complete